MFDSLVALLGVLNTFTPAGIAALLGVIILLIVHKNGPIQSIKNNHLEHVQESLAAIAKTGDKQVELLGDIKADIAYVKGKLD